MSLALTPYNLGIYRDIIIRLSHEPSTARELRNSTNRSFPLIYRVLGALRDNALVDVEKVEGEGVGVPATRHRLNDSGRQFLQMVDTVERVFTFPTHHRE